MSKLAWTGELEMLESKWTDKDGHTVKFKLLNPNESRPNPFKVFTKRRGNRAGTRFHAALTQVGGTEDSAYDGQVMLAGWGDTSTQGYTVNFWVEAPEPLVVHHLGEELLVQQGSHPFEGYRRSHDTFMAALVELDDTTDEAIDQTQRNRVEKATGTQPLPDADKGGEAAESAPATREDIEVELRKHGLDPKELMEPVDELMCGCTPTSQADCTPVRAKALKPGVHCKALAATPETWCLFCKRDCPKPEDHLKKCNKSPSSVALGHQRYTKTLANYAAILCDNPMFWNWCNETRPDASYRTVFSKEDAKNWMCQRLGIDSRKDLDTSPTKAALYHSAIRKPFVEWQGVEA